MPRPELGAGGTPERLADMSEQHVRYYSKRELRRRRLQLFSYFGVSVLAVVTAVVVVMALQR